MKIITIDARAFEAWKNKFNEFVERMDAICTPHRKRSEKWLDNSDVCRLLNVSARTMQSYRDTGKLPYSQINNKLYYKATDVEAFVRSKTSNPKK